MLRSTEVEELKTLRPQLEDLTKRYHTLLELMGEKEEQVEELKADIIDVKALYRTQISELVEQIEKLKASK